MAFNDLEFSEDKGFPGELFLFMNGATPAGFVTNDDAGLTYAGIEYKNTEYIECEDLEDLAEGSGKNDTTLHVTANFPIAVLFQSSPPPNSIWLTIYRYHRDDNDFKQYWGGKVRNVKFNGERAEIAVDSESASLERMALWKNFQPICPHIVFSEQCGLTAESNRSLIAVESVSGNDITAQDNGIAAFGGDNHTALGEARRLINDDRRTITAHIGNTITLMQPFEDLQPGEFLYILAGCDGKKTTCSSGKFKDAGGNSIDNKDNHGGCDKVPEKNPVKVGLN